MEKSPTRGGSKSYVKGGVPAKGSYREEWELKRAFRSAKAVVRRLMAPRRHAASF